MNANELVGYLNANPGKWAVVSAERPNFTIRENIARSKTLAAVALEAGLLVMRVNGCYKGGEEASYILMGDAARDVAMALGRSYDQESILTADGLEYCGVPRQDSMPGAVWQVLAADEDRDFWSQLVDGTRLVFEAPGYSSKAVACPVCDCFGCERHSRTCWFCDCVYSASRTDCPNCGADDNTPSYEAPEGPRSEIGGYIERDEDRYPLWSDAGRL